MKKNKILTIIIYLSTFIVLIEFIIIGSLSIYLIGYSKGLSKLNDEINQYSINNTVNSSSETLYELNLFNISVYSDVNDFYRIYKIMDELGITKAKYSELTGIIYYQNKSSDGYYEHFNDAACDGVYNIVGRYIQLYRCDGSLIIRGINASENESEKAILLHELGHYETYNDVTFQQKIVDDYAIENLK